MKCHWHASSNKRHCPTAPNAVPASTNDSQDDSSSHMKRHVQCVDDPSMIGEWNRPSAIRLATKVTFRGRREFSLEKYNIRRPGYDSKLPLPRKMTLQPHQILHLPRNVTLERHQGTRKETLELDQALHLPRKVTRELQNFPKCCTWHFNFTKCCTCHEKWRLSFTNYCTCQEESHLNFSILFATPLYSTLPHSTLLYSSPLCSSLLYTTLLDSPFLYTLHYSTLLYSTLLFSSLLY